MKREADSSDLVLELRCAQCGHDQVKLAAVDTRSVFSVECSRCAYVWSADVDVLIDAVRKCMAVHS